MSEVIHVLGGNLQRESCPWRIIVLQGICPLSSCSLVKCLQVSCPLGSCLWGSCPRTKHKAI